MCVACRLTRASGRGHTQVWCGIAAAPDAASRLSSGPVAADLFATPARDCWLAERLGDGAAGRAGAAACCTAAAGDAVAVGAAAEATAGAAVAVGAVAERAAGGAVAVGAVAVGAAAERAACGAVAVCVAAETAAGSTAAVGAATETAARGAVVDDAAAIRGGRVAAGRPTVTGCCLPAAPPTSWRGEPPVKCKIVNATLPPPIPPIAPATTMIHSARNTRWTRADQELSG